MRYSVLALLFFFIASGSLFPQRLNRYNKRGDRTGKWVVYQDSAKTILSMKARFKNGNATGKARYYTLDGKLARREIIRFGRIRTVLYYPGGKARMRGQARIENLPDRVHYFFYGRWKYYDENGRLVKYGYYEKGKLVKTIYLDKNNLINDSLIAALNSLEKNFTEHNRALIAQVDKNNYDQKRAEEFREQLFVNDSSSFAGAQKCLDTFGYLSEKVAGEAAAIPFFILCYAPVPTREKYLGLFKAAADKGFLSSSTLAFYIDKLMLSKGEKQVYGTQYYIDKNRNAVFYPSIDPENLEKRRELMGL